MLDGLDGLNMVEPWVSIIMIIKSQVSRLKSLIFGWLQRFNPNSMIFMAESTSLLRWSKVYPHFFQLDPPCFTFRRSPRHWPLPSSAPAAARCPVAPPMFRSPETSHSNPWPKRAIGEAGGRAGCGNGWSWIGEGWQWQWHSTGWWLSHLPLWKIWVSWGYDIPKIWKVIKFMLQTTNQSYTVNSVNLL